MVGKELTQSI